jgi:hemoglobin
LVLARSIVAPLRELTAVAEKVSTGDLDATATVRADDEIGDLAAAFNRMVVSVRYYRKRHETSIYEQIGGHDAVVAAVDGFYARVLADPLLAHYFDGVPLQRLKTHQAAFLTQALRGPERYAGRPMREAHAGHGITDAAFDRVAQHLADTLAHLGVSEALIQQIIARIAPLRPEIVERTGVTSAV